MYNSDSSLCSEISMCWSQKRDKPKNFSTMQFAKHKENSSPAVCSMHTFSARLLPSVLSLDNICPIEILTTEKYMDSIFERMLSAVCWLMTIKKKKIHYPKPRACFQLNIFSTLSLMRVLPPHFKSQFSMCSSQSILSMKKPVV